jgi:hypothetical protein
MSATSPRALNQRGSSQDPGIAVVDETTPDDLTSLEEANLKLGQAAELLALADGLCRIGRLRDGKRSGQFSIFNFRLRAAYEVVPPEAGGSGGSDPPADPNPREPLVVLMRAGIARRHTWFARVYWADGDEPMRIEAPSPLDKGWTWWLDIDEIRKRLVTEEVWMQAVGLTWEARVAEIALELANAVIVKVEARVEGR